jgi:hypothetical protein
LTPLGLLREPSTKADGRRGDAPPTAAEAAVYERLDRLEGALTAR